MVVKGRDGTLWSALSGTAIDGPQKGKRLERIASLTTDWGYWLMLHPESTAYDLYDGKNVLAAKAAGTDPAKLTNDFFADGTTTGAGRGGQSIALLDVNGDGKSDLVTTGDFTQGTGNQILIYNGSDLATGKIPGAGATPISKANSTNGAHGRASAPNRWLGRRSRLSRVCSPARPSSTTSSRWPTCPTSCSTGLSGSGQSAQPLRPAPN